MELHRKIEILNDLASQLSRAPELGPLLDLTVKSALELTRSERGFVLVNEKDSLVCRSPHDAHGPLRAPQTFSRSVCQQVLDLGQPVILENVFEDETFNTVQSVLDLSLRSVMCVPLFSNQRIGGLLYVDSVLSQATFEPADLDLLNSIANLASVALDKAEVQLELQTLTDAIFTLDDPV